MAIKIREATLAAGQFLLTNPLGWATLAIGSIVAITTGLLSMQKAQEEAYQETIENTKSAISELESINSEVTTLEENIKNINEQIGKLDPITDADDIKNLQLESAELKAQLAILKEKQEVAKQEAHDAATKSLGQTSDSKYAQDVEYVTTVTDGSNSVNLVAPLEMYTPKQVTQHEELELAMEAYRDYADEVLKLNQELEKLESEGKKDSDEYTEKSKAINDYTAKMASARKHANELAQSVSSQVDGLTDGEFKKELQDLILRYSDFTDEITANTDAINENTSSKQENSNTPIELSIEELNKNINTAYDSIQKSHDAIEKFKTAMSDGMTDDALNAVAGLSDELKAMVAEFYVGTISADELFKALTDHYSNDLENYSKAIIEKNKYSEEFYNKVGLADSKFVNYMLENYKVDLTNCKDYNTARLEIEKQTLGKLGDMWGKYYDAQTDAYKPQLEKLANSAYGAARAGVADKDNTALQLYKQITEQVSAYRKAKEEIDKITYEGISSSFEGNSSNFGGNSSSSSKAKETEKTFDHIETALSNMSDALSDLDKKVSNTYSTWTDRNKALTESINKTKEAINLQNQAYQAYMREANAVGLSDIYKRLVENGSMDISVIKDDSLADKITKYQDYYGKAQDVLKTVSELQDTLNELSSTEKWELFKSESDADISELDAYLDKVQNVLDKAELQGKFANSSAYTDMYNLTANKITVLKGQAEQLSSILGTMTQGTEAYDELFNELLSIRNQISDLENECIEFNNNIRNLDWEVFEYLEDSISRITDEMDYLIGLLDDEDLFDNKGNRTKYGDATIALHAANYDVYKQQAQDYYEEVQFLQKELLNGGGKDVLEQYNEMLDKHRDMIKSANDEKQAILDLVENGFEARLDALNEIIDKYNELEDKQQSARDYQKNIENQVKNISALEKQLMAYQNDDSEEAKSKIQQITVDLEDARQQLEETEMDKNIQDRRELLESLSLEFQEWQNARMDNSDELLSQIIGNLQTEGDEINATLKEVADANGTLISSSITSIFDANSPFTNGLTSISDGVAGTTTAINNLIAQVSGIAGILTSTNAGTNDTNKGSINSNKPVTNNTVKPQQPTTPTTPSVPSTPKQEATSKVESKPSGSDIFIYKKNYAKNLNPETSIVDRLKANNFDASFQARATYYSKLGGSGAYKGSASQNVWMIKKMKEMGYKKGSSNIPYDQMNWVHDGEIVLKRVSDGGYLTELTSGSKVLNAKQVENLWNLSNMKPIMPNVNLPKMPSIQSKQAPNVTVEFGDTHVTLPNVHKPEDFAREFKNVYANNIGKVQDMIQNHTWSSSKTFTSKSNPYSYL